MIYIIKKDVSQEIKTNFIKYMDKNKLPNVDFTNKKITFNYKYYKNIIKPTLKFEEKMYIIKEIFGAFVSDNQNINLNKIKYLQTNISYEIKLKPEFETDEKIYTGTYTADFRHCLEVAAKMFKPKTIVCIGMQRFAAPLVGLAQSNKIKMNIHCYDKFEYPLYDKRMLNLEEQYYNKDYNYKYLHLNSAIDNLAQYSGLNNIYLNYSIDNIESLISMIEQRIIPDMVILQHIQPQEYNLIIDKLLEYNKNVIIICRIMNISSKAVLLDKSHKYNPIIIPNINDILTSLKTYKKNIESTTFIITNRKLEFNKYAFKCPNSYFDDYKYDLNIMFNKKVAVVPINYLKKDLVKKCDDYLTKATILKHYNKTYEEYKTDLDLLDKYIDNDYIFVIFFLFMIKIGNLYFILNSNINIYECVFINNLIKYYITNNINKKKMNIIEIGCAYGVSGMIIVNAIGQYTNTKFNFWSIDPNQKTQWHNVGNYNINKILKENTKWHLVEEYSDEGLTYIKDDKLNRKIDICFIDGAHDYINVYADISIIDTFMEIGGLIILDDVLHQGVRDSINKFYKKYNNSYIRVYFKNDEIQFTQQIYNTFTRKSIYDPSSMFCFMKIK